MVRRVRAIDVVRILANQAALRDRIAVAIQDDARHEQPEVLRIPAQRRQADDLPVFDGGAQSTGLGFEQRSTGGDVDRLRDRAGFERDIDAQLAARLEIHFARELLEAGDFRFHAIGTGCEEVEKIVAERVRRAFHFHARTGVGDGNFGRGDNTAGSIRDRAEDTSTVALCEQKGNNQQRKRCCEK